MASSPHLATRSGPAQESARSVVSLTTVLLFVSGAAAQVWLYASILPLLFILLISGPILLFLLVRGERLAAEFSILTRMLAVGTFAAAISAYYAIVLFDPYQIASDASSFYELSSQAGPARSIQDLQTLTEGAGAVVLWSQIYDLASILGFPRLPYIGISMNVLMVAMGSVICLRSARALYGDDKYRFRRLELFFSFSGILWLFAGIHIRDSVIFLAVAVLTHVWVSYLSRLERRKLLPALIVTGILMPALQLLRNEFFYIPLLVSGMGLVALNFSRGRGDRRFIMLLSMLLGVALLIVGVVVFGSQVEQLFLLGRETYGTLSLEEARSGSLGVSLIIDQILPVRLALGIPYLLYFPIPFWVGFYDTSAVQLFKSVNALSFYVVSGLAFAGIVRIALSRQLRSPAFVFVSLTPLVLAAAIALTSLETRHLGAFVSFFFLVGLVPDLRNLADLRLTRLALIAVVATLGLVHLAWFALRYA